jgi:hypothetical protein
MCYAFETPCDLSQILVDSTTLISLTTGETKVIDLIHGL